MGMSVQSAGSVAAYQTGDVPRLKQRREDLARLGQALKSGDLNAAKHFLSALDPASSASSSALGKSGSPFALLAQALQSGNLAGAQQAFAAMRHGHHHEGHGHGKVSSAGLTGVFGLGASSASLEGSNFFSALA